MFKDFLIFHLILLIIWIPLIYACNKSPLLFCLIIWIWITLDWKQRRKNKPYD